MKGFQSKARIKFLFSFMTNGLFSYCATLAKNTRFHCSSTIFYSLLRKTKIVWVRLHMGKNHKCICMCIYTIDKHTHAHILPFRVCSAAVKTLTNTYGYQWAHKVKGNHPASLVDSAVNKQIYKYGSLSTIMTTKLCFIETNTLWGRMLICELMKKRAWRYHAST